MKMIKAAFVVSAMLLMGGCVAVPVASGYDAGAPAYYAPAPAYYAPSIYVWPSIGIGIRGGRGGHSRGHWRR